MNAAYLSITINKLPPAFMRYAMLGGQRYTLKRSLGDSPSLVTQKVPSILQGTGEERKPGQSLKAPQLQGHITPAGINMAKRASGDGDKVLASKVGQPSRLRTITMLSTYYVPRSLRPSCTPCCCFSLDPSELGRALPFIDEDTEPRGA